MAVSRMASPVRQWLLRLIVTFADERIIGRNWIRILAQPLNLSADDGRKDHGALSRRQRDAA